MVKGSISVTTSAPGASPLAAVAPDKPSLAAIHDAAQQARNLRQVLQDDKLRIGCFLGAGCPLGIYDVEGKESVVLIPSIVELTKRVANSLDACDKADGSTSTYRKSWDSLCEECKSADGKTPTIEDILTELRTLTNRRGSSLVLGMTKKVLTDLDMKICDLVTELMRKSLPAYRCSYHRFASWIGGLHSLSPIEIFTPNYDLLFEQAFEQHPLPHFDGFVGSREPWFDLASIEHDAIPARWTRLWKLHGSINWEKVEETVNGTHVTRIVRVTREAKAGKVMIFPSHLKYDQSRRMPYLAMLDRLRAFFHGQVIRKRGDAANRDEDAPRMIVCGYSFLDEHINEVLLDGLRGNRNAQCFALMYSNLSDHPRAVEYAMKQGNLTVLAKDGAVIGTRVGLYRPETAGGDEHRPWLYEEDISTTDSTKPDKSTKCCLGDFHYFGLFLEQLCGGGHSYNAHTSL
ncbi:SIR2 family protein [Geobacter sp. AOG2]|uniref:SIR2 family protein n=1 Tax=Geobacter sp. AOG2 TaxID=1566347 RepID=UPI001CC4E6A9|nr:SIR2 family protein [Geobacter sp. AOG2]GFE59618.1 SIR2 family protein [Geobacter sp. AOG2]